MKIAIKETTYFTHTVQCHTTFLIDIIYRRRRLSCDQFISYLRVYTPPLNLNQPGGPGYAPQSWFSRLVCNFYGRIYSSDDTLRIVKHVFSAYGIDAHHIDTYGSPLVLYAIQSGDIPLIDFLVSCGARLTENGKSVYNKVYERVGDPRFRIDIPRCLLSTGQDTAKHVHTLVYNEMCGITV